MNRAKIITIGSADLTGGHWYLRDWHMDSGTMIAVSSPGRFGGWWYEELSLLAQVSRTFGHDAAIVLAYGHRAEDGPLERDRSAEPFLGVSTDDSSCFDTRVAGLSPIEIHGAGQ